MSYTSVFGGNTIYPSDVSYLSIALTVDTPLEWPLESSGAEDPAARIIDVSPDASGWSIVLPDATLTGAGQTILFNNIGGVYDFYVKDHAGNTLATVTAGTQWQVYLAATTTAAGTWRVFRYGASTATVQPSALAGFGLTVTGSTLSQSLPVTTFSTSGITASTSSRASAFVWNATGAGTLNLLTAVSAGNNFFIYVRNEGGGDLTIDPAGSDTINSAATLVLRPGDSATVITDGAIWYTIGLGQEAVFAFDYTSISVTGGTVTLSGSQLNRIAYKFLGTLTSDCTILVPSTVQQYWINNATTGSFTLSVKTATGTPTQVNQGAKGIYYCDGTDIILGSDPTTLTTPIVVSDGGTGATTASGARLSLGVTTFADPIVTATDGATVLTTIGATTVGSSMFTLTNPSAITFPRFNADNTVSALDAATFRTAIGGGSVTSVGSAGTVNGITLTGTVTTSGNLTLGGTLSGVSLTTQVTGTLPIANGGTGATSAGAALTALGAYAAANPSGFTSNTGTVTSVATSGSINGLTLTGTVTTSGTITLGGSITSVAAAATINSQPIGTLNIVKSVTTGTAVVGDAGKCIAVSAGITIPNATFNVGDAISIYNDSASAVTITQGASFTLRQAGTANTGNRTLAARGMATIWFNLSSEGIISGAGVT